jgi:SAM-dependent methyltransferase
MDILKIIDPKRTRSQNGRSAWYPYYAGFSYEFAYQLLSSARLPHDALIMDDWNGSGTTTAVANSLGYSAYGCDLNPVMVVVAKARLLSKREHSSLEPLSVEIIQKARDSEVAPAADDPLQAWLCPTSANVIRKLERAIQLLLLDHEHYQAPATRTDFADLSGFGAFLYLALFRTVRTLLQRFVASNPTWVMTPRDHHLRLKPREETIFDVFRSQVLAMVDENQPGLFEPQESGGTRIDVASSEALPLANNSVRFALASPPYCTRIDYAVATKPELAVLGYSIESFRDLRKSLLGTSTVPRMAPEESKEWGQTCLTFIEKLKNHESKASATYYYKNHLQYFDGLSKSLAELRRVLTEDGTCVLVVQDSYYKDIHNDLPKIVIEMAVSSSLELTRREDFSHARTMAAVNPAAKLYRKSFSATESVLVFKRAA